jgi:mannose-6-phosphate isomerase-like protein (cupin superfamily)
MPVFKHGGTIDRSWCKLEFYEILRLDVGDRQMLERRGTREILFVVRGACRAECVDGSIDLREGDIVRLNSGTVGWNINEVRTPAVLVRVAGRWGDRTGSCGVFTMSNSTEPFNEGDPTPYDRTTRFDNHYHDCDEYWIIVEGRCVAISEGTRYVLESGDCLATGMGHHHDLSSIVEPVTGVWIETTLEGAQRLGHLWNYTHGHAEPKLDRI